MREAKQLPAFLIGDKSLRIANVRLSHLFAAPVVQDNVQGRCNLLGDVGLYPERIAGLAIVRLRPQVKSVVGADELYGHSQAVAGSSYRTLDDVLYLEYRRDLLYREVPALERECRGAGSDQQLGQSCQ